MLPTTIGRVEIEAAKGKKTATKREAIVAYAVAREVPTRSKGTDMAEYNHKYAQGVVAFKTRLATDRSKNMKDGDQILVVVEDGRKFDKVRVGTVGRDSDKVKLEVAYFVERATGNIYGAKSPLAPNLNHFYGTVYTSKLWDWSGERGVPFDAAEAGVEAVGGYGNYVHYVPKGTPKAEAAASA